MKEPLARRVPVGALAVVLMSMGCGNGFVADASPMRVSATVWTGYSPLYLADEAGDLSASSFRVVEFASGTRSIHVLANGAVDAALLTLDELLYLYERGIATRIVLVADYSAGADAIVARPPVAGVEDLRGKRIGFEPGGVSAYVLSRALERGRLATGDVVLVPMAIEEAERALADRTIDAAVVFEPSLTRLLRAGHTKVFGSEELPGEVVDVLVVHEGYLSRRPERVRELLDAWFEALARLESDPAGASARLASTFDLSPQELAASFRLVRFPGRRENAELLGGGVEPASLLPVVERLYRVMREERMLVRDGLDPRALLPPPSVRVRP